MKRITSLVLFVCSFLAVLSVAEPVYACRAYYASDTYRGDILSSDFNDFAFIWESAGDPWGCAGAARTKLEAKLPNVPVSAWQGWLSGGSVSYVMGAGLFLGTFGEMTPAVDAKIRDVAKNYRFANQPNGSGGIACGFDNGNWVAGNTCLEDYAMDASAQAWIAAYLRQSGRAGWATYRANAITAMSKMLDPQTSCIHKFSGTNDPSRGVCNGTYTDLVNGTAELISFNHGEQSLAYGIGQMTSFGSAVVALDEAEKPFTTSDLTSDRLAMAGYLFAEASPRAVADPGNANAATFASNLCYQLQNGVLVSGKPCWDEQFRIFGQHPSTIGPTPYRADMFKVKPIYDRFSLSKGGATGYMFDRFNDIFLTGPDDWDKAWGPGRRYFYFNIGSYYAGLGGNNKPSMVWTGPYAGGIKRGSYWVTSSNGTNVTLSGTSRTPGTATTASLSIIDGNGNLLRSGDPVVVKNMNGQQWLAAGGGGSTITTTSGTGTTFTIAKVGGTTGELITGGEQFTLRTAAGQYLTAPTFGGNVTATALSVGTYEKFTLDRTIDD